MIRKVIQSNPTTLVVTLPKKWTVKHNIHKGDEINILEDGNGNLILGSDSMPKPKTINITFQSSQKQYVQGIIRNLYMNGYDEIHCKYHGEEDIIYITSILHYLIGFEIVDQNNDGCTIKIINQEKKEEYVSFLRKCFHNINYMGSILQESLNNKPSQLTQQKIEDLSWNVTKFSSYCRRIIIKFGLTQDYKYSVDYLLLTFLHMISHNFLYAYDFLLQRNLHPSVQNKKYIKEVIDSFQLLSELYYNKEVDVGALQTQVKELIEDRKLMQNNKSAPFIKYFSEIARIINPLITKIHARYLL